MGVVVRPGRERGPMIYDKGAARVMQPKRHKNSQGADHGRFLEVYGCGKDKE